MNEWLPSSTSSVNPSTMFTDTKPPSSKSFADFCYTHTHTGHFPILYSQKREGYWHDPNKYPDTFRITKGRLCSREGLWPLTSSLLFWTSWMTESFPTGSNFNLRTLCLFQRKASLSCAQNVNAASRFDALCSSVLLKASCDKRQTALEPYLAYTESWE